MNNYRKRLNVHKFQGLLTALNIYLFRQKLLFCRPETNQLHTLHQHVLEDLLPAWFLYSLPDLQHSTLWLKRAGLSFWPRKWGFPCEHLPFKVESLLPLTSKRESADHATVYTACTWPRSVQIKDPLLAFHNRMVLSNDADAIIRTSGEYFTSFTTFWCPVIRVMYVFWSDFHKYNVKSSEHDTRNSTSSGHTFLNLLNANCCNSSSENVKV